jgi:biopolymer transport protein ExbD
VLQKLASMAKTQTVLIKCAPDSKHDRLVQVLDRCTQVGLSNLSVMSM